MINAGVNIGWVKTVVNRFDKTFSEIAGNDEYSFHGFLDHVDRIIAGRALD